MDIGRFNRRITIQQQSSTQDALGQPVDTWTTFASIWADIRYTGGLEAIKSGAETSIAKVSVRVRYLAGVTAGMRVSHGLETFNIVAVLPDAGGRKYVDLVCEQVL